MKKKTILLIEDNFGDIILAQEAFEEIGRKEDLIVAQNGHQAMETLELMNREGSLPKLIIMDLNMPLLNGLDLLNAIKTNEVYKYIPVILMSTSSSQNDIQKGYELHANAYIVKPFNNNEFNSLIKLLVDFWINSVEEVEI